MQPHRSGGRASSTFLFLCYDCLLTVAPLSWLAAILPGQTEPGVLHQFSQAVPYYGTQSRIRLFHPLVCVDWSAHRLADSLRMRITHHEQTQYPWPRAPSLPDKHRHGFPSASANTSPACRKRLISQTFWMVSTSFRYGAHQTSHPREQQVGVAVVPSQQVEKFAGESV